MVPPEEMEPFLPRSRSLDRTSWYRSCHCKDPTVHAVPLRGLTLCHCSIADPPHNVLTLLFVPAAQGHLRVLEAIVEALRPRPSNSNPGRDHPELANQLPGSTQLPAGPLAGICDDPIRKLMDKCNRQGLTPLMLASAAGCACISLCFPLRAYAACCRRRARKGHACMNLQLRKHALDGNTRLAEDKLCAGRALPWAARTVPAWSLFSDSTGRLNRI